MINKFKTLIYIKLTLLSEAIKAKHLRYKLLLFSLLSEKNDSNKFPIGKTAQKIKVLIVITHVASDWKNNKSIPEEDFYKNKIKKLSSAISSYYEALDSCSIKIIINSIKSKNILKELPEHILKTIKIEEDYNSDPLLVGFRAQEIFERYKNAFDWFIYSEDDILLRDSLIFNKLEYFNSRVKSESLLLLPNRYEIYNLKKRYIDLEWIKGLGNIKNLHRYFKWSNIKLGPWEFSQFYNPHVGFYCLSKKQLKAWLNINRTLYNKVSYLGPLESAATGSLMEYFSIYQPSVRNLNFLEVKHCDPTYTGKK